MLVLNCRNDRFTCNGDANTVKADLRVDGPGRTKAFQQPQTFGNMGYLTHYLEGSVKISVMIELIKSAKSIQFWLSCNLIIKKNSDNQMHYLEND